MRSSIVCVLVLAGAIGHTPTEAAFGKVNNDAEIRYDPATVVSISGSVQDVQEVTEPPALKGVHVYLSGEKGTVQVYISPASFLKAFSITFVRGDQLQISGSKIRFHGADLVLARQLRRDSDILVLRDEKGNPYWEDEVLKHSGVLR